MNTEQAELFLKALGAKHISKKKGWVNSCCVLARWTHEKGADKSPSFGISVSPGERSFFHCFACRSGSAEELLHTVELYSKDDHAEFDFALAHKMLDEELKVMPLPEYGEFKVTDKFVEWPQYWLDSFLPLEMSNTGMAYLVGRGYDMWEVEHHHLKFDTSKQMIVCPYYNAFGKFAGARGRSIFSNVSGPCKHFDYTWNSYNNCHFVWYNEEALQLAGPAVVVEGQFDCWKVEKVFPKVLANLTSKPSYDKMKNLGDCPFVIHIPDDDTAGKESILVYRKHCKELGIGYKLLEIKGIDPNEKLDPDKCHPDYLRERIEELL